MSARYLFGYRDSVPKQGLNDNPAILFCAGSTSHSTYRYIQLIVVPMNEKTMETLPLPETMEASACAAMARQAGAFMEPLSSKAVCDLMTVDLGNDGKPHLVLELATTDPDLVAKTENGDESVATEDGTMSYRYRPFAGSLVFKNEQRQTAAAVLHDFAGIVAETPVPIVRISGSMLDNITPEEVRVGVEVFEPTEPDRAAELKEFFDAHYAHPQNEQNTTFVMPGSQLPYDVRYSLLAAENPQEQQSVT